jgi:streptogramin lyase
VAVAGASYVTEKGGPRAKVYDLAGTLRAVIAADVFDPNCRNMSIAVGPKGRVWVADTVKLAIHEFAPAGGALS